MTTIKSQHYTTFLFCLESGYLEAQTLLAIECLRRFGGQLANAPVLAITPRLGPNITRDTRRRLDKLEVTYIRRNLGHPCSWFVYMNKALAAMLAEEYASTEQIILLDSDTLVIAEPEQLRLEPEVDFAICSTDKNVGTSGPEDKNEPFWLALCQCYDIDIDQLPWIVTEFERERVRFRLHSGVFAFRRNCGLGKEWVKACEQMLNSGITYSTRVPFPGDDVALAFAVVKLNLRWRLLPKSYNYQILPYSRTYRSEQLQFARILHYHRAMIDPDLCDWALTEIERELPDLYHWLKDKVPLKAKMGGLHRSLFRRTLKEWRNFKKNQVVANSKVIVP